MTEVVIFLVMVVALQAWQQRDVPSGPAPRTMGKLANGEEFSLGAWRTAHAESAVALHFWAEWCPICATEAGSVTAVAEDWPVMTIAMQSGAAEQVASYLRGQGLSWPALVDADGRVTASYGLKGVPAFVVIDHRGVIRSVSTGYTTELGMRLRLWWAERF